MRGDLVVPHGGHTSSPVGARQANTRRADRGSRNPGRGIVLGTTRRGGDAGDRRTGRMPWAGRPGGRVSGTGGEPAPLKKQSKQGAEHGSGGFWKRQSHLLGRA